MKNQIEIKVEIEAFNVLLTASVADLNVTLSKLKTSLVESMDFGSNETLTLLISKLEDSKDLTSTEDEWFSVYLRVSFSGIIDINNDLEVDALREYLATDHGIELDTKNDCILHSIGPCIIVNHNGNVFDQDSGELIFDKNDYGSSDELTALLEAYMAKPGHYPSVVTLNCHGEPSFRA